jgi:hypothetical protein
MDAPNSPMARPKELSRLTMAGWLVWRSFLMSVLYILGNEVSLGVEGMD